MMGTLHGIRVRIGLVALGIALGAATVASAAEEKSEGIPVALDAWLVAGPVAVPLPAFHDAEEHGFAVKDLLAEEAIDLTTVRPRAGEALVDGMAWQVFSDAGSAPTLAGSGAQPQRAYLATYLEVSRFAQAKLAVKSEHPAKAYLDGKAVEEGKEVSLVQGKHRLLLVTVRDPAQEAPWQVEPTLTVLKPVGEATAEGVVTAVTAPDRSLQMEDFVDADWVAGIIVNPDGDRVAVHLRYPSAPADFSERWTEIRSLESGHEGTVVRTLRCGRDGFTWAPSGHRYAYQESKDDKGSLWIADLDGGEPRRVLKDVEGLGDVAWLPDGQSLVYTVTEKEEDHQDDIKRYHHLNDRWSGWRDRDHLYQVQVDTGARRRLTAGDLSVSLQDVHPAGDRLLISRTFNDSTRHPFGRGELAELDLRTLEVRVLTTQPWFDQALYAPSVEENRILIIASPLAFDGVGKDVPEGVMPNLYDYQGFLFDPETGGVEPFTRDFDPSILGVQWTQAGILLRVQVGSRVEVVRFDPRTKMFTTVIGGELTAEPMQIDVVASFSADRGGDVVAYYGFSADAPEKILARWGSGAEARTLPLDQPFDDTLADVTLGEVKEWDFTNEAGLTIQGHIHYPPGFDPAKKYPLFLQYYGGTVPTGRHFGGRYPHNFWAALGYVVYTPQPSGAIGYGQEFSALHVNDWAQRSAQDILQGARKLLAEAPYLDGDKVGCFGSSYGGFMTMYLLANSDICTAGISHAGISSISSYWGEGWWGYSYSAAATALSYPWNRRDIYIDQSPLFRADRVEAPLLLLHGEEDTNVPIGESQQFYTALKILGKEVEFLTFTGANHRVVAYERHQWWLKAVVAWLDKHLKGEPEMWEVLFGER
jgi:dipeptidyl aminopeptidase/acylaminoacyl peptidase